MIIATALRQAKQWIKKTIIPIKSPWEPTQMTLRRCFRVSCLEVSGLLG